MFSLLLLFMTVFRAVFESLIKKCKKKAGTIIIKDENMFFTKKLSCNAFCFLLCHLIPFSPLNTILMQLKFSLFQL